ncbi:MAG: S9 family peptidase [Firmicutes bacterium]|nr:S9 family peptidase [Bacillota bacterium]
MKEKIGLDFFARLLYPSHLKARGEALYFLIKRADMDENKYKSDLYVLEGGQVRQLTASGDVQAYDLLTEGIVFAAPRTEKDREKAKAGEPLTVFQLLPYDGGEARESLRLPHRVEQAEWLPDGGLLFRAELDHALARLMEAKGGDMEKALKAMKEEREALAVIEELPFWFNGQGIINGKRTALYHYDGKEVRLLSDPFAQVDELRLNEARTKALFTTRRYEDVAPVSNQLVQLDIASGEIKPAAFFPDGVVEGYACMEDGQALALHVALDAPHGLSAAYPSLYRIDLATGVTTLLDDSGRYTYDGSVGSDVKLGNVDHGLTVTGGTLSFLATVYGDCHIIQYDLATGAFAQVTTRKGMVQEYIPYRGGYAMCAMRGDMPGEIYRLDAGGEETRMTDLNGSLMAGHTVVTPVEMSVRNEEGTEIFGWVMPPAGYTPGQRAPAILNIHGGPKTVYGSVLFHEMQYWCGQGYAVLFCNPTGSDGRGEAFADIRGKYGTIDYTDIMRFVEEAVRRFDFIDGTRMGVTGGSYGGFMTNWIVGHTDFFKAAVSQRSIANWLSVFTMSDIGYTFDKDQMLGTPWDNAEEHWRASPLRYADKVKTPTLFIHSEEDYRCNMCEGIQMYYALKWHGVKTRLCLFKGENHELSRSGKPKNRIRRLDEITRWMDQHLKR